MNEKQINMKLRELLGNLELSIPIDEIKDSDSIFNIGIDSMSIIKLVVLIEKEFKIDFDEDDICPENTETLEKLQVYIKNRMN